jgi:hypothetical protein
MTPFANQHSQSVAPATSLCAALQRALVQESQRRDAHLGRAGLELLLLQQVSLILSQLFWTQLLWRAMEVFGKLSNRTKVAGS